MTAEVTRVIQDAEVIGASLADPDRFAQLYDRYAAQLYRYAYQRVGPQHAEDVVADTFVAAFQARHSYDQDRVEARPWLFGILTRKMARHHRSEKARLGAHARAAPEATPDFADRVAARVAAGAVAAELAAALAGLPRRNRDVLLLIAWADLSYEEAAAALDIPVGTVRSRLHRAKKRVRAALSGADPTALTLLDDQ
ncbi:RNA polymerase sigma factor [Phytohabitans sp. LJ34]|uniref:RNA polymerase sigma factor n=1 Tax=Phytohabitans sp. LJ34 TaxID=3452217 RepID=UPI003F8C9A0F